MRAAVAAEEVAVPKAAVAAGAAGRPAAAVADVPPRKVLPRLWQPRRAARIQPPSQCLRAPCLRWLPQSCLDWGLMAGLCRRVWSQGPGWLCLREWRLRHRWFSRLEQLQFRGKPRPLRRSQCRPRLQFLRLQRLCPLMLRRGLEPQRRVLGPEREITLGRRCRVLPGSGRLSAGLPAAAGWNAAGQGCVRGMIDV